ncbi:helix-turn-helix domain-containing protein [Paenibacillus sp. GbtcB18]|uniref:winged helix-turn-helix transcriptional regulator n=1 Tax=Paenibacillus sp. GbtcB18 TaxID=2824763 RepID=UPI001C2F3C6E|nr:helix-turn-helix domain-containing protein [Paenibacillus sp. GbtcB18]
MTARSGKTPAEPAASSYIPKEPCVIECSIEKTLDVIGGKWAFLVIRELFDGTRRFGELQRSIASISPTALTNILRHLEKQGVLERKAFATVPVTVEYTLTPKGRDLHKILKEMKLWAAKWT